MAKPQMPARDAAKDLPPPEDFPNTTYPQAPDDSPGLVGGPATEAVPGSHRTGRGAATVTDDGGETSLPGRPRETGVGASPGKEQDEQVNT